MSEQSKVPLLRAMARNYAKGHAWDKLDGIAVTEAADEIERLRTELSELRAKAEAQAELTTSYVQVVPDKCDRIIWRNMYYHLPPEQQAASLKTPTLNASCVPDVQTMVNRFLGWKLPRDFCPDAGVSFKPSIRQLSNGRDWVGWPSGTNLLNAEQAREMLEYILAAAPSPTGLDNPEAPK